MDVDRTFKLRTPRGGAALWVDPGPGGALLRTEFFDALPPSSGDRVFLTGALLSYGDPGANKVLAVGGGVLEAKTSPTGGFRQLTLVSGVLTAV